MKRKPKFSIQLESLLDLSDKLNRTKDENAILNAALLSIMGKLRILRACVLVPDDGKIQYFPKIVKGRQVAQNIQYFEIDGLIELDRSDERYIALCSAEYEICLPVENKGEVFAVICLGKTANGIKPSQEEEYYAKLISTIAANAIQNARYYQSILDTQNSIEQRNQLLTSLFEMSKDFSNLLSRNLIVKMLSYRLMGQLIVSRFAVFLFHSADKIEPIINRFDKTPNDDVIRELLDLEQPVKIEEHPFSEHVLKFFNETGIKIVSPMIVQGAVKGVLVVSAKMTGEIYTDENIQFISALGNTAMSSLENERLFREELEKKRMEREMELAFEIQKNLLPADIPDIMGYDLSGTSIPCRLVGGDYYDFIELPDGNLLIAIADVSGKGMPAAMLMANVQAALRVLSPLGLPLRELITRINEVVYHNTAADKFVTFFSGILDPVTGLFKYINAGHNPPVLLKMNGDMSCLTEGGIILGIADNMYHYTEGSVMLNEGDVLLLYTDGVTDAMNKDDHDFGEIRLQSELIDNKNSTSDMIIDAILKSIWNYMENTPQFDDLTMVVLKRTIN